MLIGRFKQINGLRIYTDETTNQWERNNLFGAQILWNHGIPQCWDAIDGTHIATT